MKENNNKHEYRSIEKNWEEMTYNERVQSFRELVEYVTGNKYFEPIKSQLFKKDIT